MNRELQPKDQESITVIDNNGKLDVFKHPKILATIVLIGIALFSAFVLAGYFSNVENHTGSLMVLDEKKTAALTLTASITATAALLGIVSESIGNMLSNLTMPLILIVGVLYFEEFFLTISPHLVFTYLVPIVCTLWIVGIWFERDWIKQLAGKLAAFGLVMVLLVPTSVSVTKLVDATFDERINQTYEKAEQAEANVKEENDRGGLVGFIENVGDKVGEATTKAKNVVNNFVDAIAVLLITTCGIPLLVIFVFMWVVKLIFGLEIPTDGIKKAMRINPLKESKKMLNKK